MYSVLVCGEDDVWLDALCATIDSGKDFCVAAKVCDGETALGLVEKTMPEAIILDIVMPRYPEYDGMYIINHIRRKMGEYDPLIYVASSVKSEAAESVFGELRVDCVSIKPVSVETVLNNLKSAASARRPGVPAKRAVLSKADVYGTICVTVSQMGLLPHRTSTKCAVEALMSYLVNIGQPRSLTKVLYPEIARKLGLTEAAVEKNIRGAVSRMQVCESELYRRVFEYFPSGKISNGDFLSAVSGYIANRLEIGGNDLWGIL